MSRAVPVLLLALAACDPRAPQVADAGPDASFGCYSDEGGTDMGLVVGYLDGARLVEVVDGGDVVLVNGTQDLSMLRLRLGATMSVEGDDVCMSCSLDVSVDTSGGYEGVSRPLDVVFSRADAGDFGGIVYEILGSAATPEPYAGAVVDLEVACDGHGLSGAVERQDVVFALPPP